MSIHCISIHAFELVDKIYPDFSCKTLDDAYSHIGIIACSSGSTGLPKSICLTHAQLNFTFCMRKEDRGFVSMSYSSLYWFSGLWGMIGSVLKHTRIFTAQPFSVDSFFDMVEKYKVIFAYFINWTKIQFLTNFIKIQINRFKSLLAQRVNCNLF